MSVRYAFQRRTERLFGTAYEFGTEAGKEQVLGALREALGGDVTAVKSYASARPFDPAHAADWLQGSGVAPEQVAACRAMLPAAHQKPAGEAPRASQPQMKPSPAPRARDAEPAKASPPASSGMPVAGAPHQGFAHGASAQGSPLPVQAPITSIRIWVGSELLCGVPLAFKTVEQWQRLVAVLGSATYRKVRVESAAGGPPPQPYHHDLLIAWLSTRREVNASLLRERLHIPLTAAEVEERRKRQQQRDREQRNEQLEAQARQRERERQAALENDRRIDALAEQVRQESERATQRLKQRRDPHEQELQEIDEILQRDAELLNEDRGLAKAAQERYGLQPPSQGSQAEAQGRDDPSARESGLEPNAQTGRQEAIRQLVRGRAIPHLTHFTRVENLNGILQRGIVCRRDLGSTGYRWNDSLRLDGRRHANCLSISYPNYRMFYRYRQEDEDVLWAVLVLDCAILWELDCGFVETNAASTGVPQREERALKTVGALEGMFADASLRTRLRLPEHYPTNPQAEVLVFETVPTRYIREIQVNFTPNVNEVKDGHGRSFPVRERHDLFEPRHDYAHWSHQLRF